MGKNDEVVVAPDCNSYPQIVGFHSATILYLPIPMVGLQVGMGVILYHVGSSTLVSWTEQNILLPTSS